MYLEYSSHDKIQYVSIDTASLFSTKFKTKSSYLATEASSTLLPQNEVVLTRIHHTVTKLITGSPPLSVNAQSHHSSWLVAACSIWEASIHISTPPTQTTSLKLSLGYSMLIMDSCLTVSIRLCERVCSQLSCLIFGMSVWQCEEFFFFNIWMSLRLLLWSFMFDSHEYTQAQMLTETWTRYTVNTNRQNWNMTDTISGQLFSVCYRWTRICTQADNVILRLKVTVGGISICVSRRMGINHCHRDRMEEIAKESETTQNPVLAFKNDKSSNRTKSKKQTNENLHVHQGEKILKDTVMPGAFAPKHSVFLHIINIYIYILSELRCDCILTGQVQWTPPML